MHRNLSRSIRVSLLLAGLCATAAVAQSTGPLHPLDGLTTAEYWTAYDVLQQAGHAEPDTFFASVLLREPAKELVLSWTEGQPMAAKRTSCCCNKERHSKLASIWGHAG